MIQTGFLKERFIGENIRLIDGLISHTAARNIPGLLMFLDFEKAFDSVEWSFIWKTVTSPLKEESGRVAPFPLTFSSFAQK